VGINSEFALKYWYRICPYKSWARIVVGTKIEAGEEGEYLI